MENSRVIMTFSLIYEETEETIENIEIEFPYDESIHTKEYLMELFYQKSHEITTDPYIDVMGGYSIKYDDKGITYVITSNGDTYQYKQRNLINSKEKEYGRR